VRDGDGDGVSCAAASAIHHSIATTAHMNSRLPPISASHAMSSVPRARVLLIHAAEFTATHALCRRHWRLRASVLRCDYSKPRRSLQPHGLCSVANR
jgi:hypothetical protein